MVDDATLEKASESSAVSDILLCYDCCFHFDSQQARALLGNLTVPSSNKCAVFLAFLSYGGISSRAHSKFQS